MQIGFNGPFLLVVSQIAISILLVATILLQQRGTGLSATFGGEGNVYRTKRGFERILFYTTIVLIVLFFVTALISLAI